MFFLKVDALRARLRSRSEEVISDAKVSSSGHDPGAAISRVKEMENELKSLQNENRKLKEDKEDLQAQVINGGVIAGRNVLQSTASMSIADELGSLSDQQVTNFATFCTMQLCFFFALLSFCFLLLLHTILFQDFPTIPTAEEFKEVNIARFWVSGLSNALLTAVLVLKICYEF